MYCPRYVSILPTWISLQVRGYIPNVVFSLFQSSRVRENVAFRSVPCVHSIFPFLLFEVLCKPENKQFHRRQSVLISSCSLSVELLFSNQYIFFSCFGRQIIEVSLCNFHFVQVCFFVNQRFRNGGDCIKRVRIFTFGTLQAIPG